MKRQQTNKVNVTVTLDGVSVEPASIDENRLRLAVRRVLHDVGVSAGEIDVAVVDDTAIQEMNRRYLKHDYPTDVLSFVSKAGRAISKGRSSRAWIQHAAPRPSMAGMRPTSCY